MSGSNGVSSIWTGLSALFSGCFPRRDGSRALETERKLAAARKRIGELEAGSATERTASVVKPVVMEAPPDDKGALYRAECRIGRLEESSAVDREAIEGLLGDLDLKVREVRRLEQLVQRLWPW